VKRAAGALLAVVLLLAACGDDDGVFGTTTSGGESTTTVASTTTAGDTTTTVATTTTAATTTTTTAATTTTTAPPVPVVTPQPESYVYPAGAGCRDIEVAYTLPRVSGLPEPVNGAINTQIVDLVHARESRFVLDATTGCDPMYVSDPPAFLNLDFAATTVRAGLLSLRFFGSDYYQGAAHPNAFVFTLNFNPVTGDVFALDAILLPGQAGSLATLVGDHLLNDLYAGDVDLYSSWVPGVTPDMLEHWVVSGDGIEVSFDPYIVGPGAMGAPTVVVPFSELAGIVDPAGPAGPA
jgi:hypothetical protein